MVIWPWSRFQHDKSLLEAAGRVASSHVSTIAELERRIRDLGEYRVRYLKTNDELTARKAEFHTVEARAIAAEAKTELLQAANDRLEADHRKLVERFVERIPNRLGPVDFARDPFEENDKLATVYVDDPDVDLDELGAKLSGDGEASDREGSGAR